MDFAALIVMPLAAIITAVWTIGVGITSKPGAGFRAPFLASYALGVILTEPWKIASWGHLGMFAVMLFMLAMWVAFACIVGGLSAAFITSVARKLRQRIK